MYNSTYILYKSIRVVSDLKNVKKHFGLKPSSVSELQNYI